MNEIIKVGAPKIHRKNQTTVVQCEVFGHNLPKSLWFEVPDNYTDEISILQPNWIYTSLLMPAMIRGAKLVVNAPVSEKLYYALTGDLQYILRKQISQLEQIIIETQGFSDNDSPSVGQAVGTGFSAGIDSFSSIIDNSAPEIPVSYKLTHLTVLNVGAIGSGEECDRLFQKNSARLKEYSEFSGLKSLNINSNLADFYQSSFSFQQTHTIRNLSAILVLQKLFRCYFYSSGFEYTKTFVGPTYDIAYADPFILPLLSTEHLEFVSTGSCYSRLEKVIKVASFPDSYNYLDVCVRKPGTRLAATYVNCSTCWKCGRQLFTLELLGEIQNYKKVFDLSLYHASRTEIVARILKSAYCAHDTNDLEAIKLARTSGKFLFISDRILSYLVMLAPNRMSILLARLNNWFY